MTGYDHRSGPPARLHPAQRDDVLPAIQAMRAHRGDPGVLAAALALVDALDATLAACPPGEWASWAALGEAAEALLREVEAAHVGGLGLGRVEARGEAGAAPREVPEVRQSQGRRLPRGGACRAWRPPGCDESLTRRRRA